MAQITFILQAVTTANHAESIRKLLGLPMPTQIIVSVAYVKDSGLKALEEAIKPYSKITKFFVGIRNDVTSIQAIKRLLAMNVELYAVDTGSRKTIYHPKLYFAKNAEQANVIIGSANLTFGGLHNNIEASTIIQLDLSNAADNKFSEEVTNAFLEMLKKHPQHVFLIKDEEQADELFNSGRLADEDIVPAPYIASGVKKGERDNLPAMKLTKVLPPHMKGALVKPVVAEKTIETEHVEPEPVESIHKTETVPKLVWESKELTRRSLCIPTGKNTNQTGSIGLGKGMFEINPRTYFRNTVFVDLDWSVDVKRPNWERAWAKFELVIKGINYGDFDLKLSHLLDTASETYAQRNHVTQIHWEDAKKYVAKEDLLNRKLYLYRKDTHPPMFMIEID
jgi:HKD family nuclease